RARSPAHRPPAALPPQFPSLSPSCRFLDLGHCCKISAGRASDPRARQTCARIPRPKAARMIDFGDRFTIIVVELIWAKLCEFLTPLNADLTVFADRGQRRGSLGARLPAGSHRPRECLIEEGRDVGGREVRYRRSQLGRRAHAAWRWQRS